MSDTRTVTPLSNVELVVLGRLSQPAPPTDNDLGSAVHELWLRDESAERARAEALVALGELRKRGLVDDNKKLTKAGSLELRTVCRLRTKPAWSTFRQRYFPALALGVAPAPTPGKKGKVADAMVQNVGSRLGVDHAASMNELCDALIADALKMERGSVSIAQIRAHILAQRVHAVARPTVQDATPGLAASTPAAPVGDRAPSPATNGSSREAPPDIARQDASSPRAAAPPPIAAEPRAPEAQQPPDLLAFVRETLPQIGDEGRFGSEKVFVSALWQELAHRGPPADLSLDHFKRWLVTANRNRWLTLARADVVGAMDPKKVRESEIQDLGATFHFVLDPARNPAAQQGRSHVR